MKKNFISAVMIMFSSMVLFAEPAINLSKLEHDFGNIKQGKTVKTTFSFKNNGNSILKIEKIQTSCGCTGTLLSQKEIPAGGQGSVEVTFNSGTYNGKVVRYLTIYTNDKNNREIELKISATVHQFERN